MSLRIISQIRLIFLYIIRSGFRHPSTHINALHVIQITIDPSNPESMNFGFTMYLLIPVMNDDFIRGMFIVGYVRRVQDVARIRLEVS